MKIRLVALVCFTSLFAATGSHGEPSIWHLGQINYGSAWANTDPFPAEQGTVARIAYSLNQPLAGIEGGQPAWYFGLVSTVAVDCANKQTRRLSTDRYSRKLEKMSSLDADKNWHPLSADDPMNAALIAACDNTHASKSQSFRGDDIAILKWLGKQH